MRLEVSKVGESAILALLGIESGPKSSPGFVVDVSACAVRVSLHWTSPGRVPIPAHACAKGGGANVSICAYHYAQSCCANGAPSQRMANVTKMACLGSGSKGPCNVTKMGLTESRRRKFEALPCEHGRVLMKENNLVAFGHANTA